MPVWFTCAGRRADARLDPVLHVDRGDLDVARRLEGDGDGRDAVVAAGRGDVAHALDAVELLLERDGDRALDHVRARADVGAGHRDLRRREIRVLRDRQRRNGEQARRASRMIEQTAEKIGRRMKKSTNTRADSSLSEPSARSGRFLGTIGAPSRRAGATRPRCDRPRRARFRPRSSARASSAERDRPALTTGPAGLCSTAKRTPGRSGARPRAPAPAAPGSSVDDARAHHLARAQADVVLEDGASRRRAACADRPRAPRNRGWSRADLAVARRAARPASPGAPGARARAARGSRPRASRLARCW